MENKMENDMEIGHHFVDASMLTPSSRYYMATRGWTRQPWRGLRAYPLFRSRKSYLGVFQNQGPDLEVVFGGGFCKIRPPFW